MPLSIDMYLPALPVISEQFDAPAGSAQMTLSTYILGITLGQLIYGPMADSFDRKLVIWGGTLVFAIANGRLRVGAYYRTVDRDAFLSQFGGIGGKHHHQCVDAIYLSKGSIFAYDVVCHAGHNDSAVNGTHCRWLGVGMAKLTLYLLDTGHRGDSNVSHDLCKETLLVEWCQSFHILVPQSVTLLRCFATNAY